jgi:GT2 family glycosyltransferase
MEVTAAEILLIDQTPDHESATWQALNRWMGNGAVRRITFTPPSIPRAMNQGLLQAGTDYVLYLDDDIVPDKNLISSLVSTLNDFSSPPLCVAGQVIQPDETVIRFEEWNQNWFPFNSDKRQFITEVMAGNLCVNRSYALELGGFDENFKGSAYRFESDFARRVVSFGGEILFEPSVSIRHLRAERGGTRAGGHHLTTWRPHHSVGKYYYAFRGGMIESLRALLIQPLRAIRTRHHLRAPWWIPATLCAELLGIAWAFVLWLKGPSLLKGSRLLEQGKGIL